MKSYHDTFRPTRQPARRIYDAFQDEAQHRDEREGLSWIGLEIDRVHKEACDYARENDLPEPTREQIEVEERQACGHCDYGSKWAYGVARLLLNAKAQGMAPAETSTTKENHA